MVLAKIPVKSLKTEWGPSDREEKRRGLQTLLPNIGERPNYYEELTELGDVPKRQRDDGNTHAVASHTPKHSFKPLTQSRFCVRELR